MLISAGRGFGQYRRVVNFVAGHPWMVSRGDVGHCGGVEDEEESNG